MVDSKQQWKAWLYLSPALVLLLVFTVWPIINTVYMSLMENYSGLMAAGGATFEFGFGNFAKVLEYERFLICLQNTLLLCFLTVPLSTILALLIAVNVAAFLMALLVTSNVKGRNLYRAGFFVPNLIGGIVLGSIWQFIFSSILPAVGKALGWAWLSSSMITNAKTVVGAMVTVNTWQYAGYIMMIYVASIQGISQQVMEAASVDGATYWIRVRKILIPLMANAFTISLFLTLTNSFKMYDVNLALTNGGPVTMFMNKPVQASELLALNIYNTAFKYSRQAEGQAKAVIFFIVLVVVSLIQVSINKSKEVEM